MNAVRSDGVRRRHRYPLADLDVLKIGDDRGRARASEVVEQVVAVEAGAPGPDLHEPRPHGIGAGIDGDRPRRSELRVWEERVAGERLSDLGRRCTPVAVPLPVERRGQEDGEVVEDIEHLCEKYSKPPRRSFGHAGYLLRLRLRAHVKRGLPRGETEEAKVPSVSIIARDTGLVSR